MPKDPLDVIIELEVEAPLKRPAREAWQTSLIKAFEERDASAEVREFKYRDRRGAIEPQTLVTILQVLGPSIAIGRTILDIVTWQKSKGRVHKVTLGKRGITVTGDMNIDDVVKLLESLRDEK